ncbi:pyridoxamine 5'-phosphate oxidase family protein [Acidaminobacter hydrogenoformans]|uniref:Nitroimidazol reductase NimA, pyridoxamine 5'-phosphate oxidase superfamily n=1 Tax=Acidaminobacter hydrogenoformans DSM 2784 TaxID=1120920 RepID=A0A1G5S405_9FIRM|nr:pyridoxamine 5'-phosphate oxidase family protein [Acidaminobacter hydrogenoformans]SCZ81046.1 hypothetical protein SAMN03080599_02580 [Acidaminobacter hydrogenoformans DSM 2784]
MRRKDREIKDTKTMDEIVRACFCCRVGFNDNGEVYIVPLSFGYVSEGENRTLYFHSAREGRKIDLIARGPKVGFEMDTAYELVAHAQACSHSARFKSVIGSGTISFVTDNMEKEAALRQIMLQTTGKSQWSFSEAMLNSVCVFKLEVEKISCKEHL